MTQRIVALCREMGAGEGQEELLLLLAQTVERDLALRLKPGVQPEDCSCAFPLAAAMLVLDALEICSGSMENVTSFTAGDLTIRKEAGSGRERHDQAMRLLAPWLGETGFCFRGVKG